MGVDGQLGSWHVLRLEIIRKVVLYQVQIVEKLKKEEIHGMVFITALTYLIVLELGLLSGLRPIEIIRLRWKDIHSPSKNNPKAKIAIRGKARLGQSANRVVPILPFVHDCLMLLKRELAEKYISPKSKVIRFFNDSNELEIRSTPKDLDHFWVEILKILSIEFSPEFEPDQYSCRHRFRTDMLSAGAPERLLNYWMGHESFGIESYSAHRSQTYFDVETAYEPYGLKLAYLYGFVPNES
jgi:integrase